MELAGKSVEAALRKALETEKDADVHARLQAVLARLDFVERDALETTAIAVEAIVCADYRRDFKLAGEKTWGETLDAGVAWLLARRQADGLVGAAPREGVSLGNALGARALLITAVLQERQDLEGPAKKAVEATLARQNASGAWGPGRDDLFVTVTILDLRDSRVREVRGAYKPGLDWLRHAVADGPVLARASYVWLAPHGDDQEEVRAELAKLDIKTLDPITREAVGHALFDSNRAFGGAKQERWRAWLKSHEPLLRTAETKEGCAQGSMSARGSRAWATAWNAREARIIYRRW